MTPRRVTVEDLDLTIELARAASPSNEPIESPDTTSHRACRHDTRATTTDSAVGVAIAPTTRFTPRSGYNRIMDVATLRRSTAGVREVKNNLSAYLDRVRDGEEVVITNRGRPVARLTSVDPDVDRLQMLIAQGVVTSSTAPRSLPQRRVRGKGSLAHLVDDQRR